MAANTSRTSGCQVVGVPRHTVRLVRNSHARAHWACSRALRQAPAIASRTAWNASSSARRANCSTRANHCAAARQSVSSAVPRRPSAASAASAALQPSRFSPALPNCVGQSQPVHVPAASSKARTIPWTSAFSLSGSAASCRVSARRAAARPRPRPPAPRGPTTGPSGRGRHCRPGQGSVRRRAAPCCRSTAPSNGRGRRGPRRSARADCFPRRTTCPAARRAAHPAAVPRSANRPLSGSPTNTLPARLRFAWSDSSVGRPFRRPVHEGQEGEGDALVVSNGRAWFGFTPPVRARCGVSLCVIGRCLLRSEPEFASPVGVVGRVAVCGQEQCVGAAHHRAETARRSRRRLIVARPRAAADSPQRPQDLSLFPRAEGAGRRRPRSRHTLCHLPRRERHRAGHSPPRNA